VHRAPMDAIVEALPYEEGETPAVGTPVAVLLRSAAPYARVYVPEPLRASLHPGDSVTVSVDGIEHPFTGKVRYVSADASFTPYFALTRDDRARLSFVSEIDLADADTLTSGTPVEVSLGHRDD
jgi:HlyD family secretion protein